MKKHDILYEAILSSMGITEDAEPDMADADFWAKHVKHYHTRKGQWQKQLKNWRKTC